VLWVNFWSSIFLELFLKNVQRKLLKFEKVYYRFSSYADPRAVKVTWAVIDWSTSYFLATKCFNISSQKSVFCLSVWVIGLFSYFEMGFSFLLLPRITNLNLKISQWYFSWVHSCMNLYDSYSLSVKDLEQGRRGTIVIYLEGHITFYDERAFYLSNT